NKGMLSPNSYYWRVRFDTSAPTRKVGEKTIILDALDPLDPGRRAWQYIPGQRRVKLAPDLAYDTPSPVAGGVATLDEARIFLGAQDRYDMKMLGKKEIYIPYNDFKWTDYKVCPDEVSHTKNFGNPDCVRWELHRTWVVEATLKAGFRHLLPKRVMYFDEDSWSAGLGDAWDAAGKMYHITVPLSFPFYFLPYGQNADTYMNYDLQTGIVASTAGVAFPGGNYVPIKSIEKNYFSPEALAGEGIR
ncbi:MAG: DUF1329 domain-containing protein, partial [Chthoniobacterales bacterium]